jgi:hypothetical protein
MHRSVSHLTLRLTFTRLVVPGETGGVPARQHIWPCTLSATHPCPSVALSAWPGVDRGVRTSQGVRLTACQKLTAHTACIGMAGRPSTPGQHAGCGMMRASVSRVKLSLIARVSYDMFAC